MCSSFSSVSVKNKQTKNPLIKSNFEEGREYWAYTSGLQFITERREDKKSSRGLKQKPWSPAS